MNTPTKPVEQKARELEVARLICQHSGCIANTPSVQCRAGCSASPKELLDEYGKAAEAIIAALNTDEERIRRLEGALDKLLASCGARERYHALEYATAVEEAEAVLSTPSKEVGR